MNEKLLKKIYTVKTVLYFSTDPTMTDMLKAAAKLADLTWGPGGEVIEARANDADVDRDQALELTFAVEAAGRHAAADQIREEMDNRWRLINELGISEVSYVRPGAPAPLK